MVKSNLVKGAFISYISIFLNIVISFFYTPWMIKQIGISDYGLYSLVISFISYFIMDFGLSKAIIRFIANYRAEGNDDAVSNMLGITTKAYLIIDAVIFTILFILYFFIESIFLGLSPDEISKLKILYCIAGLFSVLNFMFKPMDGAMMAFEYFVENKSLDMICKVGTVSLICVALYIGVGVYALVLINGAVALCVSITKFVVFRKKSHQKINWHYFDKKQLGSITSFSIWAFGRGLAQRLRFSIVPSILGIFCNSTEISLFALGVSLEGMVYTFADGINGLLMPKVSRISHSRDRKTMMDLMVTIGRIELFIIALIYFGFAIFGQSFIHLWVGDEFSKVYYILLFLITADIVSLTEDVAENLVFVENRIKYTTTIIFVCSFLGLVGSAVFANELGALGCAACSGIALILNVIIVNVFYHKKMDLDIPLFFKQCHLRILPGVFLFALISYFLIRQINISHWGTLVSLVVCYSALYLLVCYFLLFNKKEQSLIKGLVLKR